MRLWTLVINPSENSPHGCSTLNTSEVVDIYFSQHNSSIKFSVYHILKPHNPTQGKTQLANNNKPQYRKCRKHRDGSPAGRTAQLPQATLGVNYLPLRRQASQPSTQQVQIRSLTIALSVPISPLGLRNPTQSDMADPVNKHCLLLYSQALEAQRPMSSLRLLRHHHLNHRRADQA